MPQTKTPTQKKPARARSKAAATKKPRAKKSVTKKKTIAPVATASWAADNVSEELVIQSSVSPVINDLPALDFEELNKHEESRSYPVQLPATIHSRIAFYLGVFFGAVVLHVLAIVLLAVVSV